MNENGEKIQIRNSTVDFLVFTKQNSENGIEVRIQDDTVWLTQEGLSQLFDKGRTTITEHLKHIFEERELEEDSVCRKFRHTGSDGKNYNTKFYNLDAIISVGYRVNSLRATQFQQWATKVNRYFKVDEDDKFAILPYFWIPDENLDLRVRRYHVPYYVWERQGFMQTTVGNVVHYGYIEKFIEKLGERFNIQEIAFDRWGAVQMVQNLEGMGFTDVPFGQDLRIRLRRLRN